MNLHVQSDDGTLLRIQCEGEIVAEQLPHGSHPLEQLLGAEGFRRRVLFDLQKTTFLDSLGVSWMLSCHKQFEEAGGCIVFYAAQPAVRRTLDLLRMSFVLHLKPDESAAEATARADRGK
jgi:anti-anti-sigma factor